MRLQCTVPHLDPETGGDCLSVPTELDLLPEQLLSLCSGETGLSVPLTTALIPTGCGGSQSRDEPTA